MEIFERSRKEFKVLTPGGGAWSEVCGVGGGGGAGHGEVFEEDVEGEALLVEEDGEGGGVRGAVAPGTAASFRRRSILSL